MQTHRTLEEIGDLIERSSLSPAGRERARALFQRLGEVEAAIHGVPPDQVQLHEVGALDSIIDIVGTVFAMERLRVDRVVSSPLHVGSGHVRTAHGVFPVPAPATLALLRGAPISSGPEAAEMVTPTGALLVTGYAESYGTLPAMRVRQVGYGAGAREFADTPNVLRVVIGEDDLPAQVETVTVIEAEIDDMNPQFFGPAMERLLAAGALDVYYTPVQMKKNRPGVLLTIVADPDSREALTAIVFRETTTIGVRYRDSRRERLERERHLVTTPFGDVHVKVARRGSEMINAQPEFEDCVRVAAASGRVIKDVHAAAMKAFLDQTS